MQSRSLNMWVAHAALATLLATFTVPGSVAAAEHSRTTGNLAIYLGVLPAEMAQEHPKEHPEGSMHGGVPTSRKQHHVVIAIFDARDGSRVADAEVTAQVGEIGLAQTKKRLERMLIDKTISYGNYFSMGTPGPYRIEIEIRRPSLLAPVKTSFDYSHPRP